LLGTAGQTKSCYEIILLQVYHLKLLVLNAGTAVVMEVKTLGSLLPVRTIHMSAKPTVCFLGLK